MRHIIKEFNVYTFDELDEKAKEKAINNYRNAPVYDEYDDLRDDILAFAELYNGKAKWNISLASYSYVSLGIDLDDDILNLKGNRALKYIFNNFIYPLYKAKIVYNKKYTKKRKSCVFETFAPWANVLTYIPLDIYKQIAREKTITVKKFITMLEDEFCKCFVSEMEFKNSDEFIADLLQINEYEFYSDGRQY